MPEESISKRLAAKLKITGKAKTTIYNNPNNNNGIGDLVNRPSSAELRSESQRAENIINQQQSNQRIDNVRQRTQVLSQKETTIKTSNQENTPEPNFNEPIQDYSLPPTSYVHSQTSGQQQADDLTRQQLGQDKVEPYQNAGGAAIKEGQINSNDSRDGLNNNGNPKTNTNDSHHVLPKIFGKKSPINAKSLTKSAQKALQKAAMKVVANPAAWPWIIAALAILIALIIFASFFAINYSRENKAPSDIGKSAPIQVDPIADKEWIRKVLMFAGDKDVANALTEEFLAKLKTDLETLRNEINTNQSIDTATKTTATSKIDEIVLKVESAKTATPDQKKKLAEEIKTGLNDLTQLFYSSGTIPSLIPTHLPLGGDKFTRFNNRSHFGTPTNPCSATVKNGKTCPKPGDGPARTYFQHVQNTCDAVDLTGTDNGDAVFAVFPGKITKITTDGAVAKVMYLEYSVEGHVYHATYAHVIPDSGISEGTEIRSEEIASGKQIATVKDGSDGHLHFELAIDNKCVVNTPSEKSSTGMGQLLWSKMAQVLRQQN